MSDTIEAIRKRHATTTLRAYGSHAAFHAHDDRGTLLAEVGRMSDEIVVLRRFIDRMTRERDEAREALEDKP